eukprot:6045027-Prymnesium_polylepis.1
MNSRLRPQQAREERHKSKDEDKVLPSCHRADNAQPTNDDRARHDDADQAFPPDQADVWHLRLQECAQFGCRVTGLVEEGLVLAHAGVQRSDAHLQREALARPAQHAHSKPHEVWHHQPLAEEDRSPQHHSGAHVACVDLVQEDGQVGQDDAKKRDRQSSSNGRDKAQHECWVVFALVTPRVSYDVCVAALRQLCDLHLRRRRPIRSPSAGGLLVLRALVRIGRSLQLDAVEGGSRRLAVWWRVLAVAL